MRTPFNKLLTMRLLNIIERIFIFLYLSAYSTNAFAEVDNMFAGLVFLYAIPFIFILTFLFLLFLNGKKDKTGAFVPTARGFTIAFLGAIFVSSGYFLLLIFL